jgi:hypothetical protein
VEIRVSPVTPTGSHESHPQGHTSALSVGALHRQVHGCTCPHACKHPATLCVCTHSHCDKLSQTPCNTPPNTPPLLHTPFPDCDDGRARAQHLSVIMSGTLVTPPGHSMSWCTMFMHGPHPLNSKKTRNRARARPAYGHKQQLNDWGGTSADPTQQPSRSLRCYSSSSRVPRSWPSSCSTLSDSQHHSEVLGRSGAIPKVPEHVLIVKASNMRSSFPPACVCPHPKITVTVYSMC